MKYHHTSWTEGKVSKEEEELNKLDVVENIKIRLLSKALKFLAGYNLFLISYSQVTEVSSCRFAVLFHVVVHPDIIGSLYTIS